VRTLAVTVLALMTSCANAPENRPAQSPLYETRSGTKTTHWRFVPLSANPRSFPSPGEFAHVAARCGGEPVCLAERGFYPTQCNDGVDNDADGLIDYPADPGCALPDALKEAPACDDGKDNDGDGHTDWDGAGFSHPDAECAGDASRDRERPDRSRSSWNPF